VIVSGVDICHVDLRSAAELEARFKEKTLKIDETVLGFCITGRISLRTIFVCMCNTFRPINLVLVLAGLQKFLAMLGCIKF